MGSSIEQLEITDVNLRHCNVNRMGLSDIERAQYFVAQLHFSCLRQIAFRLCLWGIFGFNQVFCTRHALRRGNREELDKSSRFRE